LERLGAAAVTRSTVSLGSTSTLNRQYGSVHRGPPCTPGGVAAVAAEESGAPPDERGTDERGTDERGTVRSSPGKPSSSL